MTTADLQLVRYVVELTLASQWQKVAYQKLSNLLLRKNHLNICF